MKKLIVLLLLSSNLYAANEITDASDGKNIAAQIKDIQMEEMLKQTSEFRDCREKNKYDPKDPNNAAALEAAQKCFQDKLANNKNPKQLEEWSNALNLQAYGLVKSKNIKDIQKYLNDKMYKAMTGIDPEEQARKKMLVSFKERKNIDQKVFIDMYKTQLGKNALYEISRFCFEDLRRNESDKTNFFDHWGGNGDTILTPGTVNDLGEPKFGKVLNSSDDKGEVYKNIFASIQGSETNNIEKFKLDEFFKQCGAIIVPLCKEFEKTVKSDTKTDEKTKGSAACLTKDRIQKYRAALAAADKLGTYFDEKMISNPKTLALAAKAMSGQPIKFYGEGGAGEESIDDLTNNSSSDFLLGGADKGQSKTEEECLQNPEISACDEFITDEESFKKATHNINMEMSLKREVEMARVRELVGKDKASLQKYLEDNGYFELAAKAKEMDPSSIVDEIGKIYDAKRVSLLQGLNDKMGKRQSSGKDDKDSKADAVKTAVTETKEERARLAQVVLFNNIITSHLELQKKKADGSTEKAGRNVNAWKKEEQALGKENIDSTLFSNLKQGAEGVKGIGNDNRIDGFDILDTFLGKATEEKKTK